MKARRLTVIALAVGLFSVAPAVAQPVNDECVGSVTIPCGGSATTDNRSATTGVADPTPSCTTGSNVGSVFFNFVATDTNARISTDLNSVGTDAGFAVYEVEQPAPCDTTQWTEIACFPGGFGSICVPGLTPGDTYAVMLVAWSAGSVGSYTVDVECPCPEGACCDPALRVCSDNVLQSNCLAPLQWTARVLCADLCPPCTRQPPQSCPPPFEWELVQRSPGSLLTDRMGHAMAYRTDLRRVVLFGGRDVNGYSESSFVYHWDGRNREWSRISSGGGPIARDGHAMATDPLRGVILFGGLNNDPNVGYLGDSWRWQWPSSPGWQRLVPQLFPPDVPNARTAHAMAFNDTNASVILYGGHDVVPGGGQVFSDTWTWNGQRWEGVPALGPGPRSFHAMAYDIARDRTVLFGGGGLFDETTWEFNGNDWNQVGLCGPTARNRHAMTYDASRGVTVLFGGSPGLLADRLNETWEWDGNTWRQVAVLGPRPSPRFLHAMAYDEENRQTVLFGGSTYSGQNDETWVYPAESRRQQFLVTGPADGTGWSWSVTDWNTFDVVNLSPPVIVGTAADFAELFVDSINDAGCAGIDAVVVTTGLFQVTVSGNQSFSICCGPPGGPSTACCVPQSLSCSCNPSIEEIPLSGEDCNRNGIDDAGDIAVGASDDLNGDGVPDECDVAIPTVSAWGLVVLVLLLLAGAKVYFGRRRGAKTAV